MGGLGSLERSFFVQCVLTLSGERHPVISGVAGTVQEVLAGAGEAVEVSQPVARIDLHDLNNNAAVARARVANLESVSETDADTLDAWFSVSDRRADSWQPWARVSWEPDCVARPWTFS